MVIIMLIEQQEHDFMRAPVVMHAISSFDDKTTDHTAASIVDGLMKCIAGPGPLRIEVTNSRDFWSILQRLHQHKEEGGRIYQMLHNIATSQPSAITADNYESAISLANDFSTAGSIGSIQDQRKDSTVRRGKATKPLTAQ